jgi:hypothetical protein
MKKVTARDEIEWRETVARMFEAVAELEAVPTELLDDEDYDGAISEIDRYVDAIELAANNWIADADTWGKVAKALIETKKKAAKAAFDRAMSR